MPRTQDLKALRRMISEAHQLIQTSPEMPQGRTARALELLGDSVVLADYLLTIEPAAVLGKMGGKATARRGPEYFRKIAAMRKTKSGGRPRRSP